MDVAYCNCGIHHKNLWYLKFAIWLVLTLISYWKAHDSVSEECYSALKPEICSRTLISFPAVLPLLSLLICLPQCYPFTKSKTPTSSQKTMLASAPFLPLVADMLLQVAADRHSKAFMLTWRFYQSIWMVLIIKEPDSKSFTALSTLLLVRTVSMAAVGYLKAGSTLSSVVDLSGSWTAICAVLLIWAVHRVLNWLVCPAPGECAFKGASTPDFESSSSDARSRRLKLLRCTGALLEMASLVRNFTLLLSDRSLSSFLLHGAMGLLHMCTATTLALNAALAVASGFIFSRYSVLINSGAAVLFAVLKLSILAVPHMSLEPVASPPSLHLLFCLDMLLVLVANTDSVHVFFSQALIVTATYASVPLLISAPSVVAKGTHPLVSFSTNTAASLALMLACAAVIWLMYQHYPASAAYHMTASAQSLARAPSSTVLGNSLRSSDHYDPTPLPYEPPPVHYEPPPTDPAAAPPSNAPSFLESLAMDQSLHTQLQEAESRQLPQPQQLPKLMPSISRTISSPGDFLLGRSSSPSYPDLYFLAQGGGNIPGPNDPVTPGSQHPFIARLMDPRDTQATPSAHVIQPALSSGWTDWMVGSPEMECSPRMTYNPQHELTAELASLGAMQLPTAENQSRPYFSTILGTSVSPRARIPTSKSGDLEGGGQTGSGFERQAEQSSGSRIKRIRKAASFTSNSMLANVAQHTMMRREMAGGSSRVASPGIVYNSSANAQGPQVSAPLRRSLLSNMTSSTNSQSTGPVTMATNTDHTSDVTNSGKMNSFEMSHPKGTSSLGALKRPEGFAGMIRPGLGLEIIYSGKEAELGMPGTLAPSLVRRNVLKAENAQANGDGSTAASTGSHWEGQLGPLKTAHKGARAERETAMKAYRKSRTSSVGLEGLGDSGVGSLLSFPVAEVMEGGEDSGGTNSERSAEGAELHPSRWQKALLRVKTLAKLKKPKAV